MIPGIGTEVEKRLAAFMEPRITDIRPDALLRREFALVGGSEPEALHMGLHCSGDAELTVVVTDPTRPLGNVQVQCGGRNNVVFFDNANWRGAVVAKIRIPGSDNLLFFNDIGDGYVGIDEMLLRSDRHIVYWGVGATSVSVSLELEGEGCAVVIGDDALISNGVWIRNYDMHSMHDLRTGAQINRRPCDTVLERHVWLGQDALLLHCERVGMGTIVGARAMLKGHVPPRVVVAGAPARVLREEISWGRHPYGMTPEERVAIGLSPQPTAPG